MARKRCQALQSSAYPVSRHSERIRNILFQIFVRYSLRHASPIAPAPMIAACKAVFGDVVEDDQLWDIHAMEIGSTQPAIQLRIFLRQETFPTPAKLRGVS